MTAILVRLGISQREAAKRTGISPHHMHNMCLGQVPSLGKLHQFISGLDLEAEPLIEAAGYEHISNTNQHGAGRATASIPLLRDQPGGDWRLADSSECYFLPSSSQGEIDFCLRVSGDSMMPYLRSGDIVGVRAGQTATEGQIVVARLGGEVTVKCWRRDNGQYLLAPLNPAYPPIPINERDVEFAILGIVAWKTDHRLAR